LQSYELFFGSLVKFFSTLYGGRGYRPYENQMSSHVQVPLYVISCMRSKIKRNREGSQRTASDDFKI